MPSLCKVYNLAAISIKCAEKICRTFRQIELVSPNEKASTIMYYQFIREIKASHNDSDAIHDKMEYLIQTTQKSDKKYDTPNSKI